MEDMREPMAYEFDFYSVPMDEVLLALAISSQTIDFRPELLEELL